MPNQRPSNRTVRRADEPVHGSLRLRAEVVPDSVRDEGLKARHYPSAHLGKRRNREPREAKRSIVSIRPHQSDWDKKWATTDGGIVGRVRFSGRAGCAYETALVSLLCAGERRGHVDEGHRRSQRVLLTDKHFFVTLKTVQTFRAAFPHLPPILFGESALTSYRDPPKLRTST